MKKRNKKILLIIIIFILIVGIILSIYLFNEKKVDTSKLKEEYYNNLYKKMYKQYEIKYNSLNIPESENYIIKKITLNDLKKDGISIEYKSYDEKHQCDLDKSYAIRKLINNEIVIKVYYKCGNDANYEYERR